MASPIDAGLCGSCGHIFSTKFVPNQTTVIPPQPGAQAAPTQPMPGYYQNPAHWQKQRRVNTAWMVAILVFVAICGIAWQVLDRKTKIPASLVGSGLEVTWVATEDGGQKGYLQYYKDEPLEIELYGLKYVPEYERNNINPNSYRKAEVEAKRIAITTRNTTQFANPDEEMKHQSDVLGPHEAVVEFARPGDNAVTTITIKKGQLWMIFAASDTILKAIRRPNKIDAVEIDVRNRSDFGYKPKTPDETDPAVDANL
jgi:hypothetical protein